jgi:serine acetyltransferase
MWLIKVILPEPRNLVTGNHARMGANAVVLDDVPAGATVVGIPASIVTNRKPSIAARAKGCVQ